MKIELELSNIKPATLNHYEKPRSRGRFISFYKPAESKLFDSLVNSQLNKYKSEYRKFNKYYDELKHYLIIGYIFYMPVLVKKKDRISKTSKDVDNIVKPLQDLIFKQLSADDSSIISISSTKIHSENLNIKVSIQVKNLSGIL